MNYPYIPIKMATIWNIANTRHQQDVEQEKVSLLLGMQNGALENILGISHKKLNILSYNSVITLSRIYPRS